MNEKISLQDLIALLAEKSNITQKDAETLVRECFDIIEEGLLRDKLLKIRNLGTFKISWVEDSESIDVTTGERLTIPAHYKATFSPDIELAEKINTLYASMEITEIDDDEYSEKIDNELDNDEEAEPEIKKQQPEIKKLKNKQEEPDIIKTKKTEPEDKPLEFRRRVTQNTYNEKLESKKENSEDKKEDSECKKNKEEVEYNELYDENYEPAKANNGFFRFFFIIVAAVILFFTGYHFYPKIQSWKIEKITPDSVIVFSYSTNKSSVPDSSSVAQTTGSKTIQASADTQNKQIQNNSATKPTAIPKTEPAAAPEAQKNENYLAKTYANKKYKVRYGERLNTIALREYGHKAFWVYIYDENRKNIGNPDLIEPGMTIYIPPAEKYGIDSANPQAVSKALKLEQQYKIR